MRPNVLLRKFKKSHPSVSNEGHNGGTNHGPQDREAGTGIICGSSWSWGGGGAGGVGVGVVVTLMSHHSANGGGGEEDSPDNLLHFHGGLVVEFVGLRSVKLDVEDEE
ncbi:unnamed protein product [Prunus brigantina]